MTLGTAFRRMMKADPRCVALMNAMNAAECAVPVRARRRGLPADAKPVGQSLCASSLPPDYKDDVPSGYILVRSQTYNTFTTIRSNFSRQLAKEDERDGDGLVTQIKIYPLAKADNPATQRFVDMTDTMYDGLVHYDESIYTGLARMLNEEPVQSKDLQMMGMLLPLGIEKGKEFNPDAATVAQLKSASAEAHAWLLEKLPTFVEELVAEQPMESASRGHRSTNGIQVGGSQLFRRGFARHWLRQLLPTPRQARRR